MNTQVKPKPYFYSRATVEILLYAIKEAEEAERKRIVDTSYSMIEPRR